MVVLDHTKSSSNPEASRMAQYLSSPYVQPLPNEEIDSKVSPLAMLTQACNKIESSMLGSPLNNKTKAPAASPLRESPKRSRSDSEDSSPTPKQARISSPQDLKVSQPLASNEKRKTPERRPSSSTSVSSSAASPSTSVTSAALSRASQSLYASSLGGFPAPMLPPGYPLPPHLAAALAASPHPPPSSGPCTNPMCTDMTCPTGAARASLLMGVPPPHSLSMLNLMHPSTAASTPIVCNWMANGEFCGRRFSTGGDLMEHLKTHTTSVTSTVTSTASTASPTLAALQQAQAQALMSVSVPSSSPSALAALQAQAAKMSSPATTVASDLAAAAAARYHAALAPPRPGLPPPPPPMGIPPHLASIYGLGNPYSLPMLYPMP